VAWGLAESMQLTMVPGLPYEMNNRHILNLLQTVLYQKGALIQDETARLTKTPK